MYFPILYNFIRHTRANNGIKFEIPVTRLKKLFDSCFRDGPMMWNSLPLNIRNIEDISLFKKCIKKRLITEFANS